MKRSVIAATALLFHGFWKGAKAASDNENGVLHPPSHPALERFEFLGPATRNDQALPVSHSSKSWQNTIASGADSGWMATHLLVKWMSLIDVQDFPSSYEPEKVVGQGSFGVVFKAKKKDTNEIVAVKLFPSGSVENGGWLTGADYEDKAKKDMIDLSRTECTKAMDIHKNQEADREGASHIVKCLEDGITESIRNHKNIPLFIVMDFVGTAPLDVWWRTMIKSAHSPKTPLNRFRSTARHMMEGLRYLNVGEEKYIHHDLKPANMVANDDHQDFHLTIIDLGTVLSTAKMAEESPSTPLCRPPEFMGMIPRIGFKLPAHSFDTYSAAMTLVDMAGMGQMDTGSEIHFGLEILTKVQNDINDFKTLLIVSRCWAKKTREHDEVADEADESPAVFAVGCYQDYMASIAKGAVSAKLAAAHRAVSSGNKMRIWEELMKLVTCRLKVRGDKVEQLHVGHRIWAKQIVGEWVESGFHHDLLAMLAPEPSDRRFPKDVLESKWLQKDYDASQCGQDCNGNSPVCDALIPDKGLEAMVAPIAMMVLCLVSCCCCTCCGACCSFMNGVPSAVWTGLALGACVFGGAFVANMWLASGIFLTAPALVLAVATAYLGINSSKMRPAWMGALATSTLWCLGISIAMRVALSPALAMTQAMMLHGPYLSLRFPILGLFKGKEAEFFQGVESLLRLTVWPSLCGVFLSAFGLYRATVKHYEEARSPQVVVQGVQLESFRQPPA